MKEIKLKINGKEVKLTDDQLKMLGIEVDTKRNNPFDRVNDTYFCITSDNKISFHTDDDGTYDRSLYNTVNYFNDEHFANQVALHQLLYRKLLKFAYDNECVDGEWGEMSDHYSIFYAHRMHRFMVDVNGECQSDGVYFSTEEAAERAIKEVIEPFMKEHPDFVW